MPRSTITQDPTHLRPHGIFNPHDSNASKASDDIILIIPLWFWFSRWKISERKAYGSQAFWCHWLNHSFYNIITVPGPEYFCLTVSTQDFETPKRKQWMQTPIINKRKRWRHLRELQGQGSSWDLTSGKEGILHGAFYRLVYSPAD